MGRTRKSEAAITHPLIEADELAGRLDEVVVCDIRWSLTDPDKGYQTYLEGHIPGAVFVDLDRDLADPPGQRGRHPLPQIEEFAATLGRLGIDPSSEVVVYDDMAGAVAARMWWMLRAMGHDASRLLAGGYQAWAAGNHPVEAGPVTRSPAEYPVPDGFTGVATADDLADLTVVDVRAPERYRGEIEPVDPRAGHIPGAVNYPIGLTLDQTGRFRDPAELDELYAGLDDDVAVSCGSGVNACHAALAMMLAGRPMPRVYVGSFSEWSRSDRPVATGP